MSFICKAQCTAENWTELNWTGSFSSVEFSSVLCCALNRQWPATAVADSWQSRTGDSRHQSSQLVAGFRPMTDIAVIGWFTTVCPDCEEPAMTASFVAESSPVQCTAGTWTKLNSWVELSVPLCNRWFAVIIFLSPRLHVLFIFLVSEMTYILCVDLDVKRPHSRLIFLFSLIISHQQLLVCLCSDVCFVIIVFVVWCDHNRSLWCRVVTGRLSHSSIVSKWLKAWP